MLKNNILAHKFLLIIVFAFFILFIFTIDCFATDNYYQESDIPKCFDIATKYLKDNNIKYYNYFVCYEIDTTNGGYAINFLFLISNDCTCYIESGENPRIVSNHTYLIQFHKEANYNISNLVLKDYSSTTKWNYAKDIKYSSFDIMNSNGTIFFQKTPLLQGVQVVGVTQVEEIPKAITEVLKMIIPIGLVVLSIFLVIFLVRLVILRAT